MADGLKISELRALPGGMLEAISKRAVLPLAYDNNNAKIAVENLKGDKGDTGQPGATGATGANGKSIYAFTAAISYATFQTYAIGDLMVNTSSGALNIGTNTSANTSAAAGAVYEKTGANAVTAKGNILGPQGPSGGGGGGGLSGATDLGNTDMNTVTATGFYRVAGGSQSANHYPINAPTAWTLAVFNGGNSAIQLASYYGGGTAGNKWRMFWRIAHADNSTSGNPGNFNFETASSPFGWKEFTNAGGSSFTVTNQSDNSGYTALDNKLTLNYFRLDILNTGIAILTADFLCNPSNLPVNRIIFRIDNPILNFPQTVFLDAFFVVEYNGSIEVYKVYSFMNSYGNVYLRNTYSSIIGSNPCHLCISGTWAYV